MEADKPAVGLLRELSVLGGPRLCIVFCKTFPISCPSDRTTGGLSSLSSFRSWSLYPSFSSSGIAPSPLLDPPSACCAFRISSLVIPPQLLHLQVLLSSASLFRSASGISCPPTCPLAPPSMNARSAHSAVRIPQAGCHVSS